VFDTKGIPATRRERIEAAVVSGDKHITEPHEAWITVDARRGDVPVLVTGPRRFERSVGVRQQPSGFSPSSPCSKTSARSTSLAFTGSSWAPKAVPAADRCTRRGSSPCATNAAPPMSRSSSNNGVGSRKAKTVGHTDDHAPGYALSVGRRCRSRVYRPDRPVTRELVNRTTPPYGSR
jgi:hypothetical protein